MKNLITSLRIALLAGAIFSSDASAQSLPSVPETPEAWKQAARNDIEAAFLETKNNHPGMADPQNPGFFARLIQAKERSLEYADAVTDAGGYRAALQIFNTMIHDGHAGVRVTLPPDSPYTQKWPGFHAVWRADKMMVYASELAEVPAGATLHSCDGQAVGAWLQSNVFPFSGHAENSGDWWTHAEKLMRDNGNPFIKLPAKCELELDGKRWLHHLRWTKISAQGKEWERRASDGEQLPVGMTSPKPGWFWIAAQTFSPDESQRAAYRKMYQDIREKRSELLKASAIVIDLRHNRGGSSGWSRDLAKALWGEERVNRRVKAYFAETQVWWRASEGNIAYLENLVGVLRKEAQLPVADTLEKIAAQMRIARQADEPFFKAVAAPVTMSMHEAKQDLASDPPALQSPVYVIVPSRCVSACLDALDVFQLFDGVRFIGAPTGADSTYMEVRTVGLPSGLGVTVIPNKVYLNRPRGNGIAYQPQIVFGKLEWSTKNFIQMIEEDVTKPRS